MTSVEKQGKTIDDAIESALQELGVAREQVEVEIVDEPSKGFLGILGARPARVRVTVKPDASCIVADFLMGVCSRMGSEITVETTQTETALKFDIDGDNLGLVIGRHGQTLDSLQYLANVIYNRQTMEHKRVTLDAGGYRTRREETLRGLAKRLAEKAKRKGRRVVLEPMNAYERRIIHMALQDDDRIVTYSEGDEPYRKVVISLK